MDELSAMCEKEYPRLVGMLSLYCGDRDTAEDLAQEALIRLCRDWNRVSRFDSPRRWLHRVAINLAHSHYRRRTVERRVFGLLGRESAIEIAASGDIEALDMLKRLPHRQKSALVLHYYLDLPVREVAQVMDVPEGTAKTLIHRGLRALGEVSIAAEAPHGS